MRAVRRPRSPGGSRRVLYFCGVRVAQHQGCNLVDPLNWRMLRLLLAPFDQVTLTAVRTRHFDREWLPLPSHVTVEFVHDDFHPRGTPGTLPRRLVFFTTIPFIVWRLRAHAHAAAAIGLVWLVEPTFFAGLVVQALYRRPLIATVIGLPKDGFRHQARSSARFPRRLLYHLVAAASSILDRVLARRAALLLVSGERLAEELGGGRPFFTSLFAETDIVARDDTCTSNQVIWLYAGGVSDHKGVETLLEALALTRAAGHDHRAVLVGHLDPHFPLHDHLRTHQLEGVVSTTGRLSWAATLEEMRHADLFIFLSRHEGMPRPLWRR